MEPSDNGARTKDLMPRLMHGSPRHVLGGCSPMCWCSGPCLASPSPILPIVVLCPQWKPRCELKKDQGWVCLPHNISRQGTVVAFSPQAGNATSHSRARVSSHPLPIPVTNVSEHQGCNILGGLPLAVGLGTAGPRGRGEAWLGFPNPQP